MTTAALPSALDVEAAALATIKTARAAGVEADRELMRARGDFARAEAQRAAALELSIVSDPDATTMMDDAAAVRECAARISDAQERGEASLRVRRSAEARLSHTRLSLVDELWPSAEEKIVAAVQARDAAMQMVRAYHRAYGEAVQRCSELAPGVRARVEEADRRRGQWRDEQLVARESTPPPCPLAGNLISKMATTIPRPAAMEKNYRPGMTTQDFDAAPEPEVKVLSKDDPRYQHRTLGVADAEPVPRPIGWKFEDADRLASAMRNR
jgi:hypothetical protein